jgi:Domain of unknown function (DUF4157)
VTTHETEKLRPASSGSSRRAADPKGIAGGPVTGRASTLQRAFGNGFIQRSSTPEIDDDEKKCNCTGGTCGCARRQVQAKVEVGPENDSFELEADRVADHVMAGGTAAPGAGSLPGSGLIQPRRFPDKSGVASGGLEIELPPGSGRPLSPATRSFMEPRFGEDFGDVRVHEDPATGQAAAEIRARAFTYQSDIYLGARETEQDHRLMAHELTHVVQQRGGPQDSSHPASPTVPAVQRAISPALDKIESYLSYGIFDWAITDAEAIAALQLLEKLPQIDQAVFFADPKYAERLQDNLPDERLPEFYSVQAGVASIAPPTSTVEDIRSKLSYGLFDWVITDEEAVEALEMLKQLSGAQLATALAAIDYGRLMDNLPDGRKQELIDLLAKGLGTGGTKQKEEEQHPGTALKSLRFKSDYGDGGSVGVIKDNDDDWSNSGAFYRKPEWSVSGDKVLSYPIAQKGNTNVEIELGLNVLPLNAPMGPVKLVGKSDVPALNFDFSGNLQGGTDQKVSLTSKGTLPPLVTPLRDKYITWSMDWRGWKRDIGQTGAHNIYVTLNAPPNPSEVTLKRMRTAVDLVSQVGTTDPHPLVRGIMSKWGRYNLDVRYANAWEMADDIDLGAQCIDIVRFVNGLLQTVGCPGTATAVLIWARPESPRTPEENVYPHGGEATLPSNAMHPDWGVGLMDANGCPNNFEAALRFEYNSVLRYYPGGVSMNRIYSTPTDVLFIFQCLAWVTPTGHKEWTIQSVITSYPDGSCSTGPIRCR